jgi:hypothetical protein
MYSQSTGPSLRKSRELAHDLDFISVHAAEGATAKAPAWLVCHYASENDRHPKEYTFTDGRKLLRHIADAVAVPDGEQETEGENDD